MVNVPKTKPANLSGFTIIELMVVMALLALLASVVVPRYFQHVERSKESILRQNLYVTRDAIDKYYADTGKYPATLQVLVDTKYLRKLPEDPFLQKSDAWKILSPGNSSAPTPTGESGVFDLRSSALGNAADGVAYAAL